MRSERVREDNEGRVGLDRVLSGRWVLGSGGSEEQRRLVFESAGDMRK